MQIISFHSLTVAQIEQLEKEINKIPRPDYFLLVNSKEAGVEKFQVVGVFEDSLSTWLEKENSRLISFTSEAEISNWQNFINAHR